MNANHLSGIVFFFIFLAFFRDLLGDSIGIRWLKLKIIEKQKRKIKRKHIYERKKNTNVQNLRRK